MLKFTCEFCGQRLGVPDNFSGKRIRCTKCRAISIVPVSAKPVRKPPPDNSHIASEDTADEKRLRPRQSMLLAMSDSGDSMAGITDSRIFGASDLRKVMDFKGDEEFKASAPMPSSSASSGVPKADGTVPEDLFDSKGTPDSESDLDNIFDSKADAIDVEAAAVFSGLAIDKPKPMSPVTGKTGKDTPDLAIATPEVAAAAEEDFGLGLLEGNDLDLDSVI